MHFTDLGSLPPARGIDEELKILASVDRADPPGPASAWCAGVHAGIGRADLQTGTASRNLQEHLLVWESAHPAVVLPRNGAPGAWANPDACASCNVPLLRRDSGGGAVVLGPGCLNVALILSLDARPELSDVTRSYALLLRVLADTVAIPNVTIHATDLALDDRKFAGHAQRRLRHTLLHHGTILYGFDLGLIDTLLPEPPRHPAWRGVRPHRDFLVNVPLARADLVACLRRLPAAFAG